MATRSSHATLRIKVVDMDHIVLRVKDVDQALRFYIDVLGLAPLRVEEYRAGKVPFPCARVSDGTIIDLLPIQDWKPVGDGSRNLDHYCLTIEPTDMAQLGDHLRQLGVTVVSDAPAPRAGARGIGNSIYIKDFEDNVIELRHY